MCWWALCNSNFITFLCNSFELLESKQTYDTPKCIDEFPENERVNYSKRFFKTHAFGRNVCYENYLNRTFFEAHEQVYANKDGRCCYLFDFLDRVYVEIKNRFIMMMFSKPKANTVSVRLRELKREVRDRQRWRFNCSWYLCFTCGPIWRRFTMAAITSIWSEVPTIARNFWLATRGSSMWWTASIIFIFTRVLRGASTSMMCPIACTAQPDLPQKIYNLKQPQNKPQPRPQNPQPQPQSPQQQPQNPQQQPQNSQQQPPQNPQPSPPNPQQQQCLQQLQPLNKQQQQNLRPQQP